MRKTALGPMTLSLFLSYLLVFSNSGYLTAVALASEEEEASSLENSEAEKAEEDVDDEKPAEYDGIEADGGATSVVPSNNQPENANDTPADSGANLSVNQTVADANVDLVYVDSTVLSYGDEQRVAFILSNLPANISGANLLISSAGVDSWVSAATLLDDAVAFTLDANILNTGLTTLVDLSLTFADGSTQEIDLTEDDLYSFTVLPASTATAEMTAYTIDGMGELVECGSLGTALDMGSVASVMALSLDDELSVSTGLVIALDPGHDAGHPGAAGQGLHEEDLTLQIANYCKAELETYPGVSVYMTRTTSACPYPNASTEGDELRMRVEGAVAAGATVYVSIHLNSYESSAASGAEVWYPNQNVNQILGQNGAGLAQDIQNKLTALGIYDRGTKENETLPSGNDYYSVIRNSKLNGIPGIIVEHAFITSATDYAILSSQSGLQRLGVADATGIAQYFGLSKSEGTANVTAVAAGNVSVTVDSDRSVARFEAKNVQCTTGVNGVSIAVARSGEDPTRYTLTQDDDGVWYVEIPLSEAPAGVNYNVTGYVRDPNGSSITFCATTLLVEENARLTVSTGDDGRSISASIFGGDIRTAQNVAFELVDSTGKAGWYQAVKDSEGTWSYKWTAGSVVAGTYTVRAWLTDVDDETWAISSSRVTVSSSSSSSSTAVTPLKVTTSYTKSSNRISVSASGGSIPSATNAAVQLTNSSGLTTWHAMTRANDGSWSASLEPTGLDGQYTAVVWATVQGSTTAVGSTKVTVTGSTSETSVSCSYDATSGLLRLSTSGGAIGNAANVAFEIVNSNGVTSWHQPTRNADGSWTSSFAYSQFANGNTVRVWATVGGSTSKICTSTITSLPSAKVSGGFTVSGYDYAAGTVRISTTNLSSNVGLNNVAVGISPTASGGERWYALRKGSDGVWYVDIPLADLGGSGTYTLQGALGDSSWTARTFATNAKLSINAGTATLTAGVRTSDNAFVMLVSGSKIEAASNVAFRLVDSAGKTSWIQAVKNTDGSWGYETSVASLRSGDCLVDVWATVGGTTASLAQTRATIASTEVAGSTSAQVKASTLTVTIGKGTASASGNVAVAIWRDGSSQMQWYGATRQSNGTWTVSVPMSSLGSGLFYIQTWASQDFISPAKAYTTCLATL